MTVSPVRTGVVVDPVVDGQRLRLGYLTLGSRALPRKILGELEEFLPGSETRFGGDTLRGPAARFGRASASGPLAFVDVVRDALLRRRVRRFVSSHPKSPLFFVTRCTTTNNNPTETRFFLCIR